MSWGGSWIGSKWFSNWFGTNAGGSVIVAATASVLLLGTPTVAVNTEAVAHASASVVQLTSTNITVSVIQDVTANATPSVVIVGNTIVVIRTGAETTATQSTVSLVTTSVTTSVAITTRPTPSNVTLTSVDVAATGGSTEVVTSDSVVVNSTDTVVTGGATIADLPDTVQLTSSDVKVYDYNDAYVRVKASIMKIYPPEIFAFSTDITTDMEVVDAMTTDMESIDGTQTVKLYRKTDEIVIDLTHGTAVPQEKVYTFNNALVRQITDRDNQTVRQIRTSMIAIQNDNVHTMDTIIELPHRDDVEIMPSDIIACDAMQTRYVIVGIDTCTLKTRWRLGARKLV